MSENKKMSFKEKIDRSVFKIREILKEEAPGFEPEIALILGSGMSSLSDEFDHPCLKTSEEVGDSPKTKLIIKYRDIFFPESTNEPSKSVLVAGKLCGRNVITMKYRLHTYEGFSHKDVAFPVWVFNQLGCKHLILTAAVGGVTKDLKVGNLMLVTDHINLSGDNPLLGENDSSLGPRFPDMSQVYDKRLNRRVLKAASQKKKLPEFQGCDENGYSNGLQQGIYVMFKGPSYETPSEVQFARIIARSEENKDKSVVVGMSTVPEAIAAKHCGMTVTAFALVTNQAARAGAVLDHSEVMEESEKARGRFCKLLKEILPKITIKRQVELLKNVDAKTACIGRISPKMAKKLEVYFKAHLEDPEQYRPISRHKTFEELGLSQGDKIDWESLPENMHYEYFDQKNRQRMQYDEFDIMTKMTPGEYGVKGESLFSDHLKLLRFNIPANIHTACIVNQKKRETGEQETKFMCSKDDPLRKYSESDKAKVPVIVFHRNKFRTFEGISYTVGYDKLLKKKKKIDPENYNIHIIAPCYGTNGQLDIEMLVNMTYDSRHLYLKKEVMKGDRKITNNDHFYSEVLDKEKNNPPPTYERLKEVYAKNASELKHSKLMFNKTRFLDEAVVKNYKTMVEDDMWKDSDYYCRTLLAVPENPCAPTFVYSLENKTMKETFEIIMQDLEKKRERFKEMGDLNYAIFQAVEGSSFGYGELHARDKTKFGVVVENYIRFKDTMGVQKNMEESDIQKKKRDSLRCRCSFLIAFSMKSAE